MNWFKYAAKTLFHGGLNLSGMPRRKRQALRGHLIILTYHSFSTEWSCELFNPLQANQFDQQLRFLSANFDVVSLRDGINYVQTGRIAPNPYLALTIDDGFLDNYTIAWPILKRYGLPATIFLATDFLDSGRKPWPTELVDILERTRRRDMSFPISARIVTHAERSTAVRTIMGLWCGLEPAERFASLKELRSHLEVGHGVKYAGLQWNQVREMSQQGIDFGSHTAYHSILPFVSAKVVEEELRQSKRRIAAELGTSCDFFAYPDGKHDERTRQAVEAAGYTAAVTQDRGSNTSATRLSCLRRIEVPPHDPLCTVQGRVSLCW